jgi:hypothetical protein
MIGTHETVNHSRKEFARGDVTTNTVEAISVSSSAGWVVFTSTAPKRTFIGISRNLISATTPAKLQTGNVQSLRF